MRLVKALCRSISGRQGSRPPEIRTHSCIAMPSRNQTHSRTATLLTRSSCSYSSFRKHQLPKDDTSPPWCPLPTPLQWKSNSSVCFRPLSVCLCSEPPPRAVCLGIQDNSIDYSTDVAFVPTLRVLKLKRPTSLLCSHMAGKLLR